MNKQESTGLQEGLNKLLGGDHTVLLNQSITQALPKTVIRLIELNKQNPADRLLDRLISGIGHKDVNIRKISATCLLKTTELLVHKKDWQRLDKLLPSLAIIHKGRTGDGLDDQHRELADKAVALIKSRGKESQPKQVKKPLASDAKDTVAIREEQIFLLAEARKPG